MASPPSPATSALQAYSSQVPVQSRSVLLSVAAIAGIARKSAQPNPTRNFNTNSPPEPCQQGFPVRFEIRCDPPVLEPGQGLTQFRPRFEPMGDQVLAMNRQLRNGPAVRKPEQGFPRPIIDGRLGARPGEVNRIAP